LRVEASQDVSPELEAAAYKSDLFERAFGLGVGFEVVRSSSYGLSSGDHEPSLGETAPSTSA
jgi:hypothetical protein